MGFEHHMVCTKCGNTYPDCGSCSTHPGEPLLDTRDKEVGFFLMKLDDRARHRSYMLWSTIGLLTGVAIGIVLFLVSGMGEISVILLGVGGSLAGAAASNRIFRPRFKRYYANLLGH